MGKSAENSAYTAVFWMNFRGVREPPIVQGTFLDRWKALEKGFSARHRSTRYVQRARRHLASSTLKNDAVL